MAVLRTKQGPDSTAYPRVLELLASVAWRDAGSGRSTVLIDPDRSALPAPAVGHYY
jgi:hypothetical protein